MRHVAAKRRHVTDLQAADHAATFNKAGGMAFDQRRLDYGGVRDGGADVQPALLRGNRRHFRHRGDVDERRERVLAFFDVLHVNEEVRAACDQTGPAIVAGQAGKCIGNGVRRVIAFPKRQEASPVRRNKTRQHFSRGIRDRAAGINRRRLHTASLL